MSRAPKAVAFDPDYVSKELGVKPTQQNRIGDPISDRGGRRTFTRWRVSIGPVETIDISSVLAELMTKLQLEDERLNFLCDEIGVEPKLTCTVEPGSAQTPDVTFSHEVIRWAAAHHVAIGVDILLWRDEEPGGASISGV